MKKFVFGFLAIAAIGGSLAVNSVGTNVDKVSYVSEKPGIHDVQGKESFWLDNASDEEGSQSADGV